MHSGIVSVVLFVSVFYIGHIEADEVEVKIVSSGYCSSSYLKQKGVDTSTYKNKVIFDPKKITTIPAKPTIPGCFRLVATNVTIDEPLRQLTTEFEMRIAANADPTKPTLQCKKKQPKCGCGEKDACMYCDACKNFKQWVKEGKVNNKAVHTDNAQTSCDCNVAKDTYDIDFEVCTPDEKEIGENMPTEVLNAVTEGEAFSLFTTINIYDFRYNSLASSKESAAAGKALKARKARGLVGCYIVASNVIV